MMITFISYMSRRSVDFDELCDEILTPDPGSFKNTISPNKVLCINIREFALFDGNYSEVTAYVPELVDNEGIKYETITSEPKPKFFMCNVSRVKNLGNQANTTLVFRASDNESINLVFFTFSEFMEDDIEEFVISSNQELRFCQTAKNVAAKSLSLHINTRNNFLNVRGCPKSYQLYYYLEDGKLGIYEKSSGCVKVTYESNSIVAVHKFSCGSKELMITANTKQTRDLDITFTRSIAINRTDRFLIYGSDNEHSESIYGIIILSCSTIILALGTIFGIAYSFRRIRSLENEDGGYSLAEYELQNDQQPHANTTPESAVISDNIYGYNNSIVGENPYDKIKSDKKRRGR